MHCSQGKLRAKFPQASVHNISVNLSMHNSFMLVSQFNTSYLISIFDSLTFTL